MFRKQLLVNGPVIRTEDVCYHFLGSQADESLAKPLDLTRNQRQKFENNKIVVLKSKTLAIFPNEPVRHQLIPGHQGLYVDCSKTNPGYCRLRISTNNTKHIGGSMFQKSIHCSRLHFIYHKNSGCRNTLFRDTLFNISVLSTLGKM